MSVSPSSSRLNNVLCAVCAVLLPMCAVDALNKIASIARHFRLRSVTKGPAAMHPSVTLRPKYGMWMRVEDF